MGTEMKQSCSQISCIALCHRYLEPFHLLRSALLSKWFTFPMNTPASNYRFVNIFKATPKYHSSNTAVSTLSIFYSMQEKMWRACEQWSQPIEGMNHQNTHSSSPSCPYNFMSYFLPKIGLESLISTLVISVATTNQVLLCCWDAWWLWLQHLWKFILHFGLTRQGSLRRAGFK